MKIQYEDDDKIEIQMSPLIDCVFLLLIFFLVTTMMKKWERQIPLSLPPMTSSPSTIRSDDAKILFSVDENGNVFRIVEHDAYAGKSLCIAVPNLDGMLTEIRNRYGTDIPIELSAYRDVAVNTVINVFDQCQLHGFTHTNVRLGSKLNENQVQ